MNQVSQTRKPSRWGWAVAALTVGFVLFLVVLVMFASRQSYDLVETDYYDRELAYQDRLDQLNRADSLGIKPTVAYQAGSGTLLVSYAGQPDLSAGPGSILLYRPSNARWDRVLEFSPDSSGQQSIEVGRLIRGLWRVQFEWRVDGKGLYSEQTLIVED